MLREYYREQFRHYLRPQTIAIKVWESSVWQRLRQEHSLIVDNCSVGQRPDSLDLDTSWFSSTSGLMGISNDALLTPWSSLPFPRLTYGNLTRRS